MSAPAARPPGVLQLAVPGADATARGRLRRDERLEMFALLQRHFDGVNDAQFERDLDEKDWALRLRRDGQLVGFTTLQLWTTVVDGRCSTVVYSGDTIMDPAAWGSPLLARGWIALVRALQATRPPEPWYWLLLSSGFRTYRFLPVFWRDFWPRPDADAASRTQQLLDALARDHFGDCYDPETGIVRFLHPQRLRSPLAALPDGKDGDRYVQYFLARNPGHAAGDELACLTTLSDDNLTAAGRRMVGLPRS